MSEKKFASGAIEEFKCVAFEFCALLEAHGTFERGPFLRQLAGRLAKVYLAALSLPDVSPDSETLLLSVVTEEQQRALREAISDTLGEFQVYWEVFDPFAKDDAEPVAGYIAGELVEIYCDLQKVVTAWNASVGSARPNDVAWSARFDFVNHWSRHVTSTLKAVDALLNMHFVEALEPRRADA